MHELEEVEMKTSISPAWFTPSSSPGVSIISSEKFDASHKCLIRKRYLRELTDIAMECEEDFRRRTIE
jgi:hypothetical protein